MAAAEKLTLFQRERSMGRIHASVNIHNVQAERKVVRVDALVDTGATFMTLPAFIKQRLGTFESERHMIDGTLCGPAKIQIEGFPAVYNEVLFLPMDETQEPPEPLLGCIPLEQCGAGVDMLGHRLIPVEHFDLK